MLVVSVMRIDDDGDIMVFKFTPLNSLIIDRKNKILKFKKWEVSFSEIRGYWKNHRVKGNKIVYYIMLLTPKKMDRITPEIDEEDIDKIIGYLKKEIKLEVNK